MRPQAAQPTPVRPLAEAGPCRAPSLRSVRGPGEVTSIHARGALCWTEPRAATACTGQPVAVQGLGDRSSGTHKTQLFGAADTESWEQEPPRRVAVHEHVRRACERVRERAAPARRHGGSGAPAAPKLGAPSAAQSRG